LSDGRHNVTSFHNLLLISLVALSTPFLSVPVIAALDPATVILTSFGNAGKGTDDTAIFQKSLNKTAIKGQTLEIPAGTYNVRPLYIPANSSVVLDAGAVIQATAGYGENDHLLNISDVQNVSISGTPGQSIFRMRKAEYTSGEFRHCLAIEGATNVTIGGIQCNDSGGDGAYIGEGRQGYSANIKILNSGFDNNRRQGLSLISGRDIVITNCTFSNTSGTAPSAGIDIEPNQTSDFLQDIVIDHSSSTGNEGSGLVFGIQRLNASSPPISIKVSNFKSERNEESGFYATNEQEGATYSAPGSILITDSSSNFDRKYGAIASYWEAGGASLTFQGLTVLNANGWKKNIDNAAITVKRGGGAVHPMGNVHFLGTSIVDTLGNLGVYFTVYDWSNIGITQFQFLNSRQLEGAKRGTGLFRGLPACSIDIS